MCGVVGIATKLPGLDRGWLTTGRDAMAHRGPDDVGEWWSADGRVGLGHRRLAIIDLSPAGHQPMHDASGNLTIVFNGEIYNYQDLQRELVEKGHAFRSHSDTEVILEAYREWGSDCLTRLNGMFAFALYDATRKVLLLARDRAGEKPLFYGLANGTLRFASELKGLLACGDIAHQIDAEALDCYLGIGYVPGARCIVKGTHKLPPAHALLFDLESGSAKTWRYWDLPAPPSSLVEGDDQILLEELERLLEDSVRRQLVADVPVGVLLSGGVDSSLVTAMAVRASKRVKTFTVGFTGFGKYDESEHARLIARHFGTEHIELQAGNVGPEVLPLLARQYDEPVIDSSMIPTYLVSQLVRKHCTVALGGDGGDELFGGYHHHNRLLWMQEKFSPVPLPLRHGVARAATWLPTGFKGRNWFQALGHDLRRDLPIVASHFAAAERKALLNGARAGWAPVAEHILRQRVPSSTDLLQRATRMDFENYMVEDILVKVDRASMLNSLELRAPLLDYRIIEFAFGRVPSRLKTSPSKRKILLKLLTQRVLPKEFDRHRKQGFSIPLPDWLRAGPWRDFSRDVLLSRESLFERSAVTALMNGHEQGRNNAERIFGLLLFELWRREYRATL